MSLMVSISGIRGIVGDSFTPDVVFRYAAAFGRFSGMHSSSRPAIVIGHDGRVSGEMFARAVTTALLSTGADVRDLGVCPTPTVQLAVEHEKAAGGISITASHNPIQWNGLKFIGSKGMFLDAEQNREVWDLAGQPPEYMPWDRIGTRLEDRSWIGKHIAAVLTLPYLDLQAIRRRRFRIVLDCVNAAGGVIIPGFLRELGCAVIELNCDVSGLFSHMPEPIPENLADLADRVKSEQADLGIAVDPDADRLVLVTDQGVPYGEEYTIATAVKFMLGSDRVRRVLPAPERSPTVVVNLSTTRAVDEIAAHLGARVVRTPVGEINVAKRVKELGALIGGEGSGGVILPAVHLGRDAIVGIGLLLQMLTDSGGSLSDLQRTLPRYHITKGKIELGFRSPDSVIKAVHDSLGPDQLVNTEDGLRIDYADYWVHLRKSNTEPIIRVIAEARTPEKARDVVQQFQTRITSLPPRG